MKKAKEDWRDTQCKEIDACLNKNNSKKAYRLVKDLTSEKQGNPQLSKTSLGNVIQKNERLSADGPSSVQSYAAIRVMVTVHIWTEEDLQQVLREEVEITVAALKRGSLQLIPAELVQAGVEFMTDVLTKICNKIWRTREWPTPLTHSLIITLPK